MQNTDIRLRRAARRTIRAEATLVLVIVIIISWSIYGLYKLSIGATDSVFGLTLTKPQDSAPKVVQNERNNSPIFDKSQQSSSASGNNNNNNNNRVNIGSQPSESQQQLIAYSGTQKPSNELKQNLQTLLQQLRADQREDNELASIRAATAGSGLKTELVHDQLTMNPAVFVGSAQSQLRHANHAVDVSKDLRRGYRLPNYMDNLVQQDYHQRSPGESISAWPASIPRAAAVEHEEDSYSNNSSSPATKFMVSFPSLMQLSNRAAAMEAAAKREQQMALLNRHAATTSSTTSTTTTAKPEAHLVSLDALMADNDEMTADLESDNERADEVIEDRVPAESKHDSSEAIVRSDEMENEVAREPVRKGRRGRKRPAKISYEEADDDERPTSSGEPANEISTTEAPPSDASSKDDEQQQQPDESVDGDNKETVNSQQDGGDGATTTEKPASESEAEQEAKEEGAKQRQVAGAEEKDQAPEEETNGETPADKSGADEESVRKTSNSIDEEVDRMTQPSLGSAMRQHPPFDYKSTVHFDDSANVQPASKQRIGQRLPGNLIARFEEPQRRETVVTKRPNAGRLSKPEQSENDLLVDHNRLVRRLSNYDNKYSTQRRQKMRRKMSSNDFDDPLSLPGSEDPMLKGASKRQRRSVEPDDLRTKPPYEIEHSPRNNTDELEFEKIKFNQLKFSMTDPKIRSMQLLSLPQTAANETNLNEIDTGEVLETSGSNVGKGAKQASPKKAAQVENVTVTDERFGKEPPPRHPADLPGINVPMQAALHSHLPAHDDFDDIEDGDELRDRRRQQQQPPLRRPLPDHHVATGGDTSRYHYLTSNDTSLQEFLDKDSLLNALMSDKLPAPTEAPSSPAVSTGDKAAKGSKKSSQVSNDHQTAPSLFSVDHGLLLYPSADEEHHHKEKSSSKKKKKHEKMKKKKKSSVGIKKGGHKKKKHKKEMKKFLKEKKFKGAKKGKKVAKGKGGQGGKKGKKLYKDKGFKKKGFKNVYHKEEFGQKKSYFDEYRDKDFKKKWKKFDDKYNYAQMKKWQAKDVKAAKKKKDHGEKYKKYDKSKWKKKYEKHSKEEMEKSSKKHKKSKGF